MANTKISALVADTAPTADDLVVTVNDPGGTPATRKSTVTNFTKAIPAVVGDSGLGGTKGLVPAPAAGDAAAGKFLKADGTFAVPAGTGAETGANSDITSMDGLTGALENPTKIVFPEAAAPATPAANKVVLYAKSDGLMYSKDDAGAETLVSGGAASSLTADSVSAPVFAADAGANDTYVATLSPVPSGYTTGTHYRFKANTANTGACSINFNSLGAKTIKKAAGGITTDLADNDIRVGQWVDLVYDGTNMQMQSTSGNAPGGGIGGSTGATDNAILRADGTGGATLQNGGLTLNDSAQIVSTGNISLLATSTVELRWDGSALLGSAKALGSTGSRWSNLWVSAFSPATDTPAQLLANVNNYNPGTQNYYQRLDSDASRDITGINPGGVTVQDGQSWVFVNIGANNIVLKHESASSSAANRFLCSTGADITLSANQAADVWRDVATQRYRVYKRN